MYWYWKRRCLNKLIYNSWYFHLNNLFYKNKWVYEYFNEKNWKNLFCHFSCSFSSYYLVMIWTILEPMTKEKWTLRNNRHYYQHQLIRKVIQILGHQYRDHRMFDFLYQVWIRQKKLDHLIVELEFQNDVGDKPGTQICLHVKETSCWRNDFVSNVCFLHLMNLMDHCHHLNKKLNDVWVMYS